MNKSKEFDNILDRCIERLVKGDTVDNCLKSFPAYAKDLRPLLETALAARQVAAICPRAEYRERAKSQLSLAFQEMTAKKQRRSLSWDFHWHFQPRWAAGLAVALVVLLGGGSTVLAANNSMPDSPLYSVKLTAEKVQVALTPSDLGKSELYARLADRRVDEIVYMAAENKPEKIEKVAMVLDSNLAHIATLNSNQGKFEQAAAPAPLAGPNIQKAAPPTVTTTVPTTTTTPRATTPAPTTTATPTSAPAPASPPAAVTIMPPPEISSAGNTTKWATPGSGDTGNYDAATVAGTRLSPEDSRKAKLKEMVKYNAILNPAKLRLLLDTVPEESRPALLKAIAVSEAGYEKALESLNKP